ncbi:MAG: DUF3616 domain-containing protein [Cytophagales bacterium]
MKQILLQFDPKIPHLGGKKFRDGLSCVISIADTLWLSCDESISVERLSKISDGVFAEHTHFKITDFFHLPVDEEKEIDIEGMDFDGDFLWIVGSHSLKRKKPKPNQPIDKQLSQLSRVEIDENRYFFGKIPVEFDEKGLPFLVNKKLKNNFELKPALMKMKNGSNQLMKLLRKDEHFCDFLTIPGKDNGFDIEGLSVHKNKLYIGLRGPVLRGWACVLELNFNEANGYLELDEDKPYFKHFLKLDGMGIREMCFKGDDLYILAGPTMDLDGTISVFSWSTPLTAQEDTVNFRESLNKIMDIPHGYGEDSGKDKAEGMCYYENQLLVAYDSPKNSRLIGEYDVMVDLFKI